MTHSSSTKKTSSLKQQKCEQTYLLVRCFFASLDKTIRANFDDYDPRAER